VFVDADGVIVGDAGVLTEDELVGFINDYFDIEGGSDI